MPEFTEHNGSSAKRRAEDQKRKRDERKGPQLVREASGQNADENRTREEKEKNQRRKNTEPKTPEPEQKTAPAASPRFADDSNEMAAAEFLFDKMRFNNPRAKEPSWQGWAKEFDLIFRIDKRDYDEVLDVIEWCQLDSFWRSNILSPATLRKQYDKLNMQRQDPRRGGTGPHRETSAERIKRIFVPGPPLTPRT